jgi:hypothetical protein
MPPPLEERKRASNRLAWRNERQTPKTNSIRAWNSRRHAEGRELAGLWKKDRAKDKADQFTPCVAPEREPCKGYYYAKDPVSIEGEFAFHAFKWTRDTKHYSSVGKMVLHPSYLRIIGMGRQVLPLLLKELEARSNHWLIALNAITGEDPATPESTFQEAVDTWLSWGRNKGYMG